MVEGPLGSLLQVEAWCPGSRGGPGKPRERASCDSLPEGPALRWELTIARTVVSPQLKEKHKQSGGGVGALEELENAFSLAEESCPGISDKLMAHLVERVQR